MKNFNIDSKASTIIENQLEKEKEKKILEIGPGIGYFNKGERELRKNEFYIGLEIDPDNLDTIKTVINAQKKMNEIKNKTLIINGDGENIPLNTESIDEIIPSNVLGDGNIEEEKKIKIIKDCKRVLKSKGKIIITETITPNDSKDSVNNIKEDQDFEEIDMITGEGVKEYDKNPGNFFLTTEEKGESFVITFQKK